VTVAVVGAGTIGIGWITLFLANGLPVRVTDPRPDLERTVRDGVREFARTLPGGPADPDTLMTRLTVESDVEHAVDGADVIQENGPENLALKRELFGRIEQAAPANALLLSSTSGLLPDDIGGPLVKPGRVLVGHPFNPPHVLPLVEVVPGRHTAPDTVTAAVEFYRSVGKTPVVLHKAVPGFVANRLQAAMFRECVHLVQQGVVDIEELDAVVTGSLGPRWATVGPFLAFHLGGGRGGLRRFLTHLGPGMERSWRGLGQPHLDEETVRYLAEEADRTYGGADAYVELAERRDTKQNAVLSALTQNSEEPC
jgi:ketoreductase RED1